MAIRSPPTDHFARGVITAQMHLARGTSEPPSAAGRSIPNKNRPSASENTTAKRAHQPPTVRVTQLRFLLGKKLVSVTAQRAQERRLGSTECVRRPASKRSRSQGWWPSPSRARLSDLNSTQRPSRVGPKSSVRDESHTLSGSHCYLTLLVPHEFAVQGSGGYRRQRSPVLTAA